MTNKMRAIIIGAGHNGLVTAAYLARAGLDVLVLERRDIVGGACVTEELFPGFRVSSCSYICHMLQSKVIDDLELRKHGFEVHPVDPYRFQPFPNGRYMLLWQDHERTAEEAGRISRRDGQRVRDFYAFWGRAAGILHRYFLKEPPTLAEVARAVQGTPDEPAFERMLTGSIADLVEEHFESEEVRATFLDAQDAGDPRAPGSIAAMGYIMCDIFTELRNWGIPHGGMGGITQAMASAARAHGVEIRTGVEVRRIAVGRGRATGVVLASGETLPADVVVSNADPKRTFLALLDAADLPEGLADGVGRLKSNVAYFKFHCALRRLPDFTRYLGARYDLRFLTQVRICPSVGYFEQAWNEARNGIPPAHPVMHIQVPSVLDKSLTAPGTHVMSVWGLYAPVHPHGGTWDELREQAGRNIIETISQYAPDFKECIVDWQLFTPLDLERRNYLTDGNIRHLDIVPGQMFSLRPGYRTPVAGLYLCGAGTHPGGEVTGAPGHNAAHAILRDMRRVK
ncbi:MAG: NAD(P)/FAD-dependent oxidoreductase [SAR202 cluster bacterium]|nr:NAD(P)/FAD-dependent oxidoreductase [SAR202 cluster bacterium]